MDHLSCCCANIIVAIILRALAAMATGYPLDIPVCYGHTGLVLGPGRYEVSRLQTIVKTGLEEVSFIVYKIRGKKLFP